MAQTSLPSHQRVVPGSVDIPLSSWPDTTKDVSVDASEVASRIVGLFNELLSKRDHTGVAGLFLEDSYWRDHLALTFDLRTMKGRSKIISFLDNGHHLENIEIVQEYASKNVSPEKVSFRGDGSVHGIQVFTCTRTKYGSGPGHIRLIQDGNGEWAIWTLYTSMTELNEHPEPLGNLRPNGAQHGFHQDRKNWLERREEDSNFEKRDPDVLIVGGGQAGLSVTARLKMLNVSALIVDNNESIGDAWRKRYKQLVLHDPIWYDHMPYIKFPSFWPIFTPKDKIADFLKSYAEMLELNVWNSTDIKYSSWDEKKKRWDVVLQRKKRDGTTEVRVLHPYHIIQATGHSGKPNLPRVKGMETFEGDVLCHSSDFKGAKKDGRGKRAVVIGACNSAMDISQDFCENGYDVTIIQRSSTTVMSSKAILELLCAPVYAEDGPPVEVADLLTWSKPSELYKAINVDITKLEEEMDKDTLAGLNKAGFKTDSGPMDGGLWVKYLQRGGGYYIEVGIAQLIIDGKIKVKHGVEISEILPNGLKFEDGSELEADEIVFATGYLNMKSATQAIFGEEVASKIGNCWGYDSEGETQTMWRPSGHEGFWLHGGNLAICRYFSQLLAIQIKARLEGISKPPQT
ncbi:FAD/NAD(P)-binding domain-containing protein [Hypoxylon sp. FL1150]|nr:FAD/NAD(P)-binding domain-containing protein [Hypoxylon sp. FL1150]